MARHSGPFAAGNPWRKIGVAAALAVTVGAGLLGFVVLPIADRASGTGIWDAICIAVGLPGPRPRLPPPPPRYASAFRWPEAAAGDKARGEAIARTCGACHGDDGISASPWIPSLAAMRDEVTAKQLSDFASGHRNWGVMNAVAASLGEAGRADVAAYYASLPPPPARQAVSADPLRSADPVERLVFAGDPARGVAPCAACHGLGGLKRGAPILAGQHPEYLQSQLDAFSRCARHNDQGEQMRAVAARLTAGEMADLAQYLSAHAATP